MADAPLPSAAAVVAPRRLGGVVAAQRDVSGTMRLLEIDLAAEAAFAPGQFCMLNLAEPVAMVLGRPLSIFELAGRRLRLLYKAVGRGTRRFAAAVPGDRVSFLGPLGVPFPPRDGTVSSLVLAGGVGLPPLLAWCGAHGGPGDVFCFGGRDGADVPWELLPEPWRVSQDLPVGTPAGREAFVGTVVDMARDLLDAVPGAAAPGRILACGPLPMLRAAAALAAERGMECLVSVEERMGCGYGVCRGCVVPLAGGGHLASCTEGPVLDARRVDWDRFGADAGGEGGAG